MVSDLKDPVLEDIDVNFELVASDVTDDWNWVSGMITSFEKGKVSTRDLVDDLKNRMTSAIMNIEKLRSSIDAGVTDVVIDYIDNQHRDVNIVYDKMLRYLKTFQTYFPESRDAYLYAARNFSIWRHPRATPGDVQSVTFGIEANETWITWAEFMDIGFFSRVQLPRYLEALDRHVFEAVSSPLNSMDSKLQDLQTDISISYQEALYFLEAFNVELTEDLILLSIDL